MGQTIEDNALKEEWRMKAELDNLVRLWHEDKLLPYHHLIIREKVAKYKELTGKEYLYSLATDYYERGD